MTEQNVFICLIWPLFRFLAGILTIFLCIFGKRRQTKSPIFIKLLFKVEKTLVTFLSNSNRFPVQYVLLNFTYIPTHTKVREFICHFSRIVLVTKPGQPIFPNYQQRRWNNFKDGWDTYVSTRFWQLMGILLICSRNLSRCKAGLVEERLHKKLHSAAILNFLLRSLFVYLLTNCSSQFFSRLSWW